jgi:site-specific DNA-cytosine methylase
MGLPPDYPLRGAPTAQFKQAGAAVPPALAEAVTRSVLAGLQ